VLEVGSDSKVPVHTNALDDAQGLACKLMEPLPTLETCNRERVHHEKYICVLVGSQGLLNHPVGFHTHWQCLYLKFKIPHLAN
jgi:hypothetical protein